MYFTILTLHSMLTLLTSLTLLTILILFKFNFYIAYITLQIHNTNIKNLTIYNTVLRPVLNAAPFMRRT